jgi:GT2 family glycosyltransferase
MTNSSRQRNRRDEAASIGQTRSRETAPKPDDHQSHSYTLRDIFNRRFYELQYVDIAHAVRGGLNPEEHFFIHGLPEGRFGSFAFNTHLVRGIIEKQTRSQVSFEKAALLFTELSDADKFVPNDWFNPHFFQSAYGDQLPSSLGDFQLFQFYLANAGKLGLSPNGLFDEAAYQARHPDIVPSIEQGDLASGFIHFVIEGWSEGRAVLPYFEHVPSRPLRDYLLNPSSSAADFLPWFDETLYLAIHEDVHHMLRSGRFKVGLEHYLTLGFAEGRVPHPHFIAQLVNRGGALRSQELTAFSHAPNSTIPLRYAEQLSNYVIARGWHSNKQELQAWLWRYIDPPYIAISFDAQAYLRWYPDLIEANYDPRGLEEHWKTIGIREGRTAPSTNLFAQRQIDYHYVFTSGEGVNYIGPLSLPTGMGYAARGNISALKSAGIAVAEFDVSGIIHAGHHIDIFSQESLPYSRTIIHLNPDQIMPLITRFGTSLLDRRFNIGYWVWELPTPRPEWRNILSAFDLIITPSTYSAAAFGLFTNTPIVSIPHVVSSAEIADAAARTSTNPVLKGIEEQKRRGVKLVLMNLDASSVRKRKGVDVFLRLAQAVHGVSPDKYLFCLKTHSTDSSASFDLEQYRHSDLLVLDELWEWSDVCNLKALADVFISPHRSEGFGLNIVEAIVLGTPSIVSGYGGIVDILGKDYPLYIEGTLKCVGSGGGPYKKDAIWFEPDHPDLLRKLRYVLGATFDKDSYKRDISIPIENRVSADAVGGQFLDVLKEYTGFGLKLSSLGCTLSVSKSQCFVVDAGDTRAGEIREALAGNAPIISVITPAYNSKKIWLLELFDDLIHQTDGAWEWCIYNDASTDPETNATLRLLREKDARVMIKDGSFNLGIAEATNQAVAISTGEIILLVDHDDRISPELVSSYRQIFNEQPSIDIIYCDEDKIFENGERGDEHFKPDWSPEHLLSVMYVLHCLGVRKSVFLELGGYRGETSGAQDHDFALRAAAARKCFYHIDKILYHWRVSAGSAALAADAKPYSFKAGLTAVRTYVEAMKLDADVEPGLIHGTYRIRPRIPDTRVALNILTAPSYRIVDGKRLLMVEQFVRSILANRPNLDITIRVIANAGRAEELKDLNNLDDQVVVQEFPVIMDPFNFASKANWAIRSSPARYNILLNDDMEALDAGWVSAMVELLGLPGVGVVGARLLYEDNTIQHAGLVLGVNGISTHIFLGASDSVIGYNAYTHVIRNYSAVTGACMAFTRDIFDRVGGFDEKYPHDFNDTDFCLRVGAAGLRVVYTPFATLRHFESQSLFRTRADPIDAKIFASRWNQIIERDPYYNRNLPKQGAFWPVPTRE